MPDMNEFEVFYDDVRLAPWGANVWPNGYMYVVAWPTQAGSVVKVGETWSARRWRSFVRRGAQIVVIVRSSARAAMRLESALHDELSTSMEYAFASRAQSLPFLGKGDGWTECYRGNPEDVRALAERLMRNALVQG